MSDLPTNPQINALMVRKDHGAPEFTAASLVKIAKEFDAIAQALRGMASVLDEEAPLLDDKARAGMEKLLARIERLSTQKAALEEMQTKLDDIKARERERLLDNARGLRKTLLANPDEFASLLSQLPNEHRKRLQAFIGEQ